MPNNYLIVLYKHIIQVEVKNMGLKVGGGAQTYHCPIKKGGAHAPLAPPPPLPTPVIYIYIYIYIDIYIYIKVQRYYRHTSLLSELFLLARNLLLEVGERQEE